MSVVRELFSPAARRQRYLDVEAALADAQAEAGVIPAAAAAAIGAAAHYELLDGDRLAAIEARTGHSMVALVTELSRLVGDPHGGWVHWGATTQNIQQTGDVLGIRTAHSWIEGQVRELLGTLADLGDRTADVLMAGRTHGQHAVPITFGFKVAAWSDILLRHLDRLHECAPRVSIAMTGGAAGTFASLGAAGPTVQAGVAARLGLTPMAVPSRSIVDPFAELVCILGLVMATAQSIAEEIARLMGTEFGELSEPVPDGDVGSSTMPQKRNAKMCQLVSINAAQVRALVPLALEATIQSHEVDGSRSAMMDTAVQSACGLTFDGLDLLGRILTGLEVFPARMRSNLALSGGLISAEAVMMSLAPALGRQRAHEVVHNAAHRVATTGGGDTFAGMLLADSRVTDNLDAAALQALLDPAAHTGLAAEIAHAAAARARAAAAGSGSTP